MVAMIASALCFATNVLLIRALGTIESVNIWLMSCVRFVVGIALVAIVFRRDWRPSHLVSNRKLAMRGLIGGLSVCLYYTSIVHLGAGRATFINNTYIIFGALLAVWLLKERLRSALAIGSVAALTGLALLTNAFAASSHASFYDFIGVLGALASGYAIVTIRQLHATEHTSTIFTAQCAYGLLICLVPAAFYPVIVGSQALVVLLLAGVVSAVGQVLMTLAFRDLPIAEGALLQILMPLATAVGGAVFFGEHFFPHELLGAGLILAGSAFTAVRRST